MPACCRHFYSPLFSVVRQGQSGINTGGRSGPATAAVSMTVHTQRRRGPGRLFSISVKFIKIPAYMVNIQKSILFP